jgi:hypothetical protein
MNEEKGQAHRHGACCEASEAVRHFCRAFGASEQVSEHFRQSRIEFLKGIRTILDERIERLGRTAHKGTRVVVE